MLFVVGGGELGIAGAEIDVAAAMASGTANDGFLRSPLLGSGGGAVPEDVSLRGVEVKRGRDEVTVRFDGDRDGSGGGLDGGGDEDGGGIDAMAIGELGDSIFVVVGLGGKRILNPVITGCRCAAAPLASGI